jgi:hypothetical protein
MRRRLSRVFAILSLLLCIASVALCVVAHRHSVVFRNTDEHAGRRAWGVWANRGGLTVSRFRPAPSDVRGPGLNQPAAHDTWFYRIEAEARTVDSEVCGFAFAANLPSVLVDQLNDTSILLGYNTVFTVPWWFLIAGSAVPPLCRLLTLKRRLRRRRREKGLCAQCGYDLRGSRESGRCPECGTGFLKQLAALIRRLLTPRPDRATSPSPA